MVPSTGINKVKAAVFISGTGSNLKSLIKFSKTKKIFKWLKKNGISDREMLKTFNCGVGFCLIIEEKNLKKVQKYFANDYKPYVIGKITKGKNKVKLNGSINWFK